MPTPVKITRFDLQGREPHLKGKTLLLQMENSSLLLLLYIYILINTAAAVFKNLINLINLITAFLKKFPISIFFQFSAAPVSQSVLQEQNAEILSRACLHGTQRKHHKKGKTSLPLMPFLAVPLRGTYPEELRCCYDSRN